MLARIRSWITYCDLFAVPVLLTFQGKRAFYTLAGGILSIVLALSFVIIFTIYLYHMINSPSFVSHTSTYYL